MDYDLKIINGTIVDGSGKPGYRGDVGIKDGRVVALGEAPGEAKQVIDARDRVVAPGFVDIHTHYDAQVIWDRMLTISPWHGVTTVVMGNCGFTVAPTRPEHRELMIQTMENVEGMSVEALKAGLGLDWPFETFPQYMDAIEKRGTAINVAPLIGHTAVRLYVMGRDSVEREATAEEIARMREIVREAIEAGALGFATSHAFTHVGFEGKPVPSRLSSFDEIRTLAGVLGEAGHGVMQATAGKDLSFDEFAKIYEEIKRPISWTALLGGGQFLGMGSPREQLKRSKELIAKGYNIVPQVTGRALNFEFQFRMPFILESLPCFKPISAADFEGRKKLYADPAFREGVKKELGNTPITMGWNKAVISWYPPDPSLEERKIADVARERGMHPVDLAFDLALNTELEARFRMPVANHDEDEVAELISDPDTVLGLSDAGAHASQLCDACFSTYLLGRWVREKKTLTLEQAVRMLTSRPAEVFGIKDRGRLAVGVPADVVVFDPQTVGAGSLNRVQDQPGGADRLVSPAYGIEAVIVNGVLLRQNGEDRVDPNGPLPGRLLRHGQAAPELRQAAQ